jgi:hypothetical protein
MKFIFAFLLAAIVCQSAVTQTVAAQSAAAKPTRLACTDPEGRAYQVEIALGIEQLWEQNPKTAQISFSAAHLPAQRWTTGLYYSMKVDAEYYVLFKHATSPNRQRWDFVFDSNLQPTQAHLLFRHAEINLSTDLNCRNIDL